MVFFLPQHPLHRLYGGEHAFALKEYLNALKQAGFSNPQVISPWRSPINFAPYSLDALKGELARRASLGVTPLGGFLLGMFRLSGVWALLRWGLERLDRRPGRLYSFVTEKN